MKIILPLAVSLFALAAPAVAAERNYTVTSFERVRIEGPFAVTLVTNRAPFARASGSPRALDGINLRVEGTTLIIQANSSPWASGGKSAVNAGPVTISVGTHDLRQAVVSGSGSLAIDKVRGQVLGLSVSGSAEARLATADLDQLRLSLTGSGTVLIGGKSKSFSALVRGPGLLDSSGLVVRDLQLTAQGAATVRAAATGTAKVTATGTAQVTISGRPACTAKALGSASIAGCDR